MKKSLLIGAMLVLAVSATACSKKVEETTAAETTTVATTEATTEETTEEEIEETYMTGVITKLTDTILTVKSDDDDSEKDYDISDADVIKEFDFSEGDAVEICYPDETTENPVPVISVEVIESVIGATTDPSVVGTVEDATTNTITLKLEDGNSYTFNRANAYVVGENGIIVDKEATVTFLGDVEDTEPAPLALKIVMEDSYDSEKAKLSAFTGTVASIEDNAIVLESANEDFCTFTSESIDFSSFKEDTVVTVYYEGFFGGKEITATKVVK